MKDRMNKTGITNKLDIQINNRVNSNKLVGGGRKKYVFRKGNEGNIFIVENDPDDQTFESSSKKIEDYNLSLIHI